MRSIGRLLAVAALASVGAASAWAATGHGTPKNDVIHGSAKADVIRGLGGNDRLYGGAGNDRLYGGPGNDKLYGGPGNDVLVGGPGKDLLDCGPGHDVAYRDRGDRVVHCEVVHGPGPTPPPPPPPPPTTTTATTTAATTTAPAGVTPQAGHYCGYTDNGGPICFDITPAPSAFTNATYSVTYDNNDCSPTATGRVDYTTSGAAPVGADGSFDFAISSGDEAGTAITGTVDSSGGAQGNLVIHSVIASGGETFTCGLNTTWKATRQ